MKISVVIPSFNAAKTIGEAIDSALSARYLVEVIVQDGGSTDGTVEILQSYGDRIRYYSEPDSGQADALNRALRRSTGDIIGWLNADDYYASDTIDLVVKAAAEHPEADAYYGDFSLVDAGGKTIRDYRVSKWDGERFFLKGCYVWSGALFLRRRVFEEHGMYDEALHYCMDLDLLLRIGRHVRPFYIPSTLGYFRRHDASKSIGTPMNFVREGHAVQKRYTGGSPKLTLFTAVHDVQKFVYIALRGLRFSPLWSRVRQSKRL